MENNTNTKINFHAVIFAFTKETKLKNKQVLIKKKEKKEEEKNGTFCLICQNKQCSV